MSYIHRADLGRRLQMAIKAFSAEKGFWTGEVEQAKAVYRYRDGLTDAIISALLADYRICRKRKTERTL